MGIFSTGFETHYKVEIELAIRHKYSSKYSIFAEFKKKKKKTLKRFAFFCAIEFVSFIMNR